MFNQIMEMYQKYLDNFKGIIDQNLSKVFLSKGYNEFTKLFLNYMLDTKDEVDKNMEQFLDLLRISSKHDMDEIGEDIADLRRNLKLISAKLDKLTKDQK